MNHEKGSLIGYGRWNVVIVKFVWIVENEKTEVFRHPKRLQPKACQPIVRVGAASSRDEYRGGQAEG